MSFIRNIRRKTRAARFSVFQRFADGVRGREASADSERSLNVIDLGGTPTFWRYWWPVTEAHRLRIVLINNHEMDKDHREDRATDPFIENLNRDATTLTTEELRTYDVVFSNSFLEHLGTRAAQVALAKKIVASGRPYFMQVPNRFSPIDPHHPFFPFFGALPEAARARLLTVSSFQPGEPRTTLDIARRWQSTYAPLSLGDMRNLFPDAQLEVERPLGVPMSILAFRGSSRRDGVSSPTGLAA